MEPLLFAAVSNTEHLYYVLCALLLVGGFVGLFFAGEGLHKHGGLGSTWISTLLCMVFGVVLLYYGFSSLVDFYHGNHETLDEILENVDKVTRVLR